jgi:ferritin
VTGPRLGETMDGMEHSKFTDLLVDQVANEFAASHQYVAIAVWFDDQALPKLAAHFYAQALEERNHAMMMVQYLLDADLPAGIPAVAGPIVSFTDAREPVDLALQQERRVSEQIQTLARTARDEGDYIGEQFMNWFLKEQVEEVASMSDLLKIVDRAGDNLFHVEDYVARELQGGGAADPTAPKAAGGLASLTP